jgi:hypothetical protein
VLRRETQRGARNYLVGAPFNQSEMTNEQKDEPYGLTSNIRSACVVENLARLKAL